MHARPPARRLTVLLIAAVLLGASAHAPAVAHTEVLRASPSPGEEVIGPVGSVELTFLDPVEPDVRIEVQDPSGRPVAGSSAVAHSEDGRRASVTFPAQDDAGDYVVEYQYVALDGDASRETYRFTLLPPEQGEDGPGTGAVVGALVVVVVLLGGLALALRRRRGPR